MILSGHCVLSLMEDLNSSTRMLETELTWEPQLIQGWPEFVTRV